MPGRELPLTLTAQLAGAQQLEQDLVLAPGADVELPCPLPDSAFGEEGDIEVTTRWDASISPLIGTFSLRFDLRDVAIVPRRPEPAIGNASSAVLLEPAMRLSGPQAVAPANRRDQWSGTSDGGARAGLAERADYDVVREDAAGRTFYRIRVPLSSLAVGARVGTLFRFGAVVFDDDDGDGYDYWYQMSPGIAGGWNPERLPRFALGGEREPEKEE